MEIYVYIIYSQIYSYFPKSLAEPPALPFSMTPPPSTHPFTQHTFVEGLLHVRCCPRKWVHNSEQNGGKNPASMCDTLQYVSLSTTLIKVSGTRELHVWPHCGQCPRRQKSSGGNRVLRGMDSRDMDTSLCGHSANTQRVPTLMCCLWLSPGIMAQLGLGKGRHPTCAQRLLQPMQRDPQKWELGN